MSTSIMHIKPEDIDSIEKRRGYTISIIGCEKIGILHACLFAESGFQVICVDTNRALVNNLARGKALFLKREIEPVLKKHVKGGCLKAMNDVKAAVAQSDITVVTTPAEIDERKKVSYSSIENVCKKVGSSFRRGALVIVMSVVGPGTTDGLIREILESTSGFKRGVDFGLAYSPIRVLDERTLEKLAGYKRIVAATDKNSLNVTSTILEVIAKNGVIRTEDVKTVEAVTLFESVQHYANVALTNEFALFCEKAGIDYVKAQRFAGTSVYDALALPTLTCRNVHGEPYLLLEEAENLNVKLRIPTVAREVNEEILKHAVSLIREALRSCGKTLRRAKISLLGVSQTPNVKDAPKDSTKRLAKMLETKGAKISVYDPYLRSNELADLGYPSKKTLTDAMESVDCIVILTGHNRFKRLNLKKLRIMAKMPAAIVDFEGVITPEKVEMEGFIYRGLGRGVWKK
ncbi:MAG: nucleotide sugar dehydrogenase [Candidatus Bathyarchaeia archaeon]|nr:nucleotide sugar dehydrogenase [Candidatus Bathyarchaeia archaeon]